MFAAVGLLLIVTGPLLSLTMEAHAAKQPITIITASGRRSRLVMALISG
jgi:hypothetical protein